MVVRKESLQSLLIEICFNETRLSFGTGFIVLNSLGNIVLITNRHNFTGRHQVTKELISKMGGIPNRIVVWQNSFNGIGCWHAETYQLYDESEKPKWIEHPHFGERADIVGLALDTNPLARVFPYKMDNATNDLRMTPGDPLSVVGFPFGLTAGGRFAIWATGFLATEMDVDYDNLPMFLIDCRARPGQSGSPVIASRNGPFTRSDGALVTTNQPISELLGVYSGRVNDQSDLGMVWKRSAIVDLVSAS